MTVIGTELFDTAVARRTSVKISCPFHFQNDVVLVVCVCVPLLVTVETDEDVNSNADNERHVFVDVPGLFTTAYGLEKPWERRGCNNNRDRRASHAEEIRAMAWRRPE